MFEYEAPVSIFSYPFLVISSSFSPYFKYRKVMKKNSLCPDLFCTIRKINPLRAYVPICFNVSSTLEQSISISLENVRGFQTFSGGLDMAGCRILENIQINGNTGTRWVKKTHLKQNGEIFNINLRIVR